MVGDFHCGAPAILVVRGGRKINQLPDECIIEVDIRIPVGMDTAVMRQNVANVIARYPEASFEVVEDHRYPAIGIRAAGAIAACRPISTAPRQSAWAGPTSM